METSKFTPQTWRLSPDIFANPLVNVEKKAPQTNYELGVGAALRVAYVISLVCIHPLSRQKPQSDRCFLMLHANQAEFTSFALYNRAEKHAH